MKRTFAAELADTPEVQPNGKPSPKARSLFELERHDAGHDPNELLKRRYLCRAGGLLFAGPTGIGKSVLGLQCAILWAIGRECFGIVPASPLKSLFIQAENDDGDLAEIRDGIIAGLKLTPAEIKQARQNIFVHREDAKTSTAFFCDVVEPLLAEHRPDLLWIDPALAYIGGEASSQRDVGAFLRNGLNPLLHKHNCGAVLIHHTNKPPAGREKAKWAAGDFAYLGSGSAEWANWARAVLALRGIGSHSVFEFHAAKRGKRLGWKNDGEHTFVKFIAHAKEPGAIYWREVEADEAETEKGGRPKDYDIDDVYKLLPKAGLTSEQWQSEAQSELGIKRSRFFDLKKKLTDQKRVAKSVINSKWLPQ